MMRLIFVLLLVLAQPAFGQQQEKCTSARTVAVGDVVGCVGILVPAGDIRSMLAEIEALNARVEELRNTLEIARLNAEKGAIDLKTCEDTKTVIRNTLFACETAKAPSIVECPKSWGGWPWLALGAGVVAGGVGGWGIGRATCP